MMKTKYGNAKLNNKGYYVISSGKEGNNGKLLHRLIFEDYHDCKLDSNDIIHHIDGDPLNNHPANLICMSRKAHQLIHNKGKKCSKETKQKISESKKCKKHSEKTKYKMSVARNTSGYINVYKQNCKTCKQGFKWAYRYYDENGKRKAIYSVDIKKLKEKVKAKGLKWFKIEKEDD